MTNNDQLITEDQWASFLVHTSEENPSLHEKYMEFCLGEVDGHDDQQFIKHYLWMYDLLD